MLLNVRSRFFQTEITIKASIVIVAIAHAITAMSYESPAVDLCRLSATSFLATKYTTVLVLDVLITTRAFLFLKDRRVDSS